MCLYIAVVLLAAVLCDENRQKTKKATTTITTAITAIHQQLQTVRQKIEVTSTTKYMEIFCS